MRRRAASRLPWVCRTLARVVEAADRLWVEFSAAALE
jgi:hypothetical protein